MTATLANYLLPAAFIKRYRPVKSHPNEKALGGYLFDPGAARFFIRMATVDPVPPEAIWTVLPAAGGAGPFRIVSGRREQPALGHVICQVPFADDEDLEFTPAGLLTYRARLRIATLQNLLNDLRQAEQLAGGGEVTAFIERRIEQLQA